MEDTSPLARTCPVCGLSFYIDNRTKVECLNAHMWEEHAAVLIELLRRHGQYAMAANLARRLPSKFYRSDQVVPL